MNTPSASQQITFLTVRDLDTSTKFYAEALGFKLARDQGPCRIYRITENSFIGLVRGTPPENPEGAAFCIVTDEVDAFYGRVTEYGYGTMFKPRMNEKFKIYHFFLKDPDGYTIEIQRFLEPLVG